MRLGVLKFGGFKLKSGRDSPYFFNAGLFSYGSRHRGGGPRLQRRHGRLRADLRHAVRPGLQGHPAGRPPPPPRSPSGTGSICRSRSTARNRRITARAASSSAARCKGRVLIVDDVITAGTAIRESIDIIRAAGAHPAGVLLALDRQERGAISPLSAVQEVREQFGIPVIAVISLQRSHAPHARAGPPGGARRHAALPGPLRPHRLRQYALENAPARGSKWRRPRTGMCS